MRARRARIATMGDIAQLSMPWWHYCVRAALVYAVLLVLVRISGKRTVGEFTPFDLIVVLLLAESMQGALVQDDTSVAGPALTAATLIALDHAIGWASARSRAVDRMVSGVPTVLVHRGRIVRHALRRENVPIADLEEAVRRHALTRVADVELAVLETDGRITIIPATGRGDDG